MAGNDNWQMVPAPGPSGGVIDIPVRLSADEALVWTGRPRLRRFARPSLVVLLLGLGITGLGVGWIPVSLRGLRKLWEDIGLWASLVGCLPFCGVPFLLVGVGILCLPFLRWRAGGRTYYLLTSRRAVVCEPGWNRSMTVYSYPPDALHQMKCVEYPDGTGDLVFEEHPGMEAEINGRRTTGAPLPRGFLGIDRVRAVEQLVRQTLGR